MRLGMGIAAAAVIVAGCGGPPAGIQKARVDIGQCAVTPTDLRVGTVDFVVTNLTGHPAIFAVTEDAAEVGSVAVPAQEVAHLRVHLDAGDEYRTRCDAVPGPTIVP